MKVAITSIIWPERCESSYMIAHFCEHFSKTFNLIKVYIFLETMSHTMTHLEGFPII